jgi:hypothetical protein
MLPNVSFTYQKAGICLLYAVRLDVSATASIFATCSQRLHTSVPVRFRQQICETFVTFRFLISDIGRGLERHGKERMPQNEDSLVLFTGDPNQGSIGEMLSISTTAPGWESSKRGELD